MDSFLKMDVFFVVATLAVVLIAIPLSLVLLRAYRILTHLEAITKQISEETVLVRDDINMLRTGVRKEYLRLWRALRSAGAFLTSRRNRKSDASNES
jgi:hypothetical protein